MIRGKSERLSLIERREIKNIKPKIEGHKPKNNKQESRHAASTTSSKRSVVSDISLDVADTEYLSTFFEEKRSASVLGKDVSVPAAINNPPNTLFKPLVPNKEFRPWFQPQKILSSFTVTYSSQVLPSEVPFPVIAQSSLNCNDVKTPQPKPLSSHGNIMATKQRTLQPRMMDSPDGDDFLDALSAFFKSYESNQEDDLLSLDEISVDFVNPFRF